MMKPKFYVHNYWSNKPVDKGNIEHDAIIVQAKKDPEVPAWFIGLNTNVGGFDSRSKIEIGAEHHPDSGSYDFILNFFVLRYRTDDPFARKFESAISLAKRNLP